MLYSETLLPDFGIGHRAGQGDVDEIGSQTRNFEVIIDSTLSLPFLESS